MSVSGSGSSSSSYGSYWGGYGKPYDCGNPGNGHSPDINPKGEGTDDKTAKNDNGDGGPCIICGNNGGDPCSRNLPGNGNNQNSNQSDSCSGGSGDSSSSSSSGAEGGPTKPAGPGVTYNEQGDPQWVSYFNVKV